MTVLGGELLVSCSLLFLYEPEFWGGEVLVLTDRLAAGMGIQAPP